MGKEREEREKKTPPCAHHFHGFLVMHYTLKKMIIRQNEFMKKLTAGLPTYSKSSSQCFYRI